MGNSMTYGPVPVSDPMLKFNNYEKNISKEIPPKFYLNNKNKTDRYSRNGSNRGNGIRTS